MQRRVQLCSTLTLMFFSSLTTRCLLSVYAHLIRMKDKLLWNKFASLSVSSPMLTHLFLSVFSLFSCAHSCLWVHGNVWDSRVGVLYLDAFLRYFFDWTARCLNKKKQGRKLQSTQFFNLFSSSLQMTCLHTSRRSRCAASSTWSATGWFWPVWPRGAGLWSSNGSTTPQSWPAFHWSTGEVKLTAPDWRLWWLVQWIYTKPAYRRTFGQMNTISFCLTF